jgi:hypothetical protein
MSWSMESTHEAAVAAPDVFRCYADPTTWGQWAHNTTWGHGPVPLETGSVVRVRVSSMPWTYTVRVRALDAGRRIVTEVRPFGVVITSTYEVTPTPTGSRIHHIISLAGPLEVLYKGVRGQYSRMLVEETRRVAELAAGGPLVTDAGPARQTAARA